MSASGSDATPRIVAAVDGSAPSVAALRWAVRQAELTRGSVDAVIAWEYPYIVGGTGWAPTGAIDDTDYSEVAAKSLAEAIGEVNPPPGVPVNQIVREGYAAQVILETARGADLLVVGNRGHGGLTDALIGSVSVRCLHHSPCPIVVVHASHV
jgi:nucleotide-binding universal stress UspA family protein